MISKIQAVGQIYARRLSTGLPTMRRLYRINLGPFLNSWLPAALILFLSLPNHLKHHQKTIFYDSNPNLCLRQLVLKSLKSSVKSHPLWVTLYVNTNLCCYVDLEICEQVGRLQQRISSMTYIINLDENLCESCFLCASYARKQAQTCVYINVETRNYATTAWEYYSTRLQKT